VDISDKVFIGKIAELKDSNLKTIRSGHGIQVVVLPTGKSILRNGQFAHEAINEALSTQWTSKTFKFKDSFIDSILEADEIIQE
jgi:hypothetical protein